jgi:hypothetical protein
LATGICIFGFLTESDGQYSWTIPILRDLIAAAAPYIVEQLEKELSELN